MKNNFDNGCRTPVIYQNISSFVLDKQIGILLLCKSAMAAYYLKNVPSLKIRLDLLNPYS